MSGKMGSVCIAVGPIFVEVDNVRVLKLYEVVEDCLYFFLGSKGRKKKFSNKKRTEIKGRDRWEGDEHYMNKQSTDRLNIH